jgi:tRNA threonylcarbamoyladenosine biosynthesis protein TsaE
LISDNKLISHSPEETAEVGKHFAGSLKINSVVGLYGDLGSGKTQFVKGICSYFNIKDTVSSPTFILVNEYTAKDVISDSEFPVYHFDLYRLKNISELREIGFKNYISSESICIIEWAELAEDYLQNNIIKVFFQYGEKENERIINF